MIISLAEPSHIDSLANIVKSTFHLACPEISDRELQSVYISKHLAADNFKQILSSDNHHVWVALVKNEPIGLAVLEGVSDELAMLSKLYVLPTYHGKGIAKKLCRKVLEQAKKSGFITLSLTVYSGNFKAKRFYEKLGFKLIEEIDFKMESELHLDHLYKMKVG